MAGQTQEAVAAPAVWEQANAPAAGPRGNILLVEDNLINQQVALGILQIQGYRVTVVNNGREALRAHAENEFDLILMDCHMPEMDGFEATREIRAREQASGRRVAIVALTANAMAHDREECLNAGMDDHLSKPFSMQTLQDMLDRWMPGQALDRQVLDQLGKLATNGKPELLARIISLYLAESPKLVQSLKRAASDNDFGELVRTAHSLRSSSANVGAMALSRHCERMEGTARREDAAEVQVLVAKIQREHGSVQAALAAQHDQLAGAAV
jgi:two-component system, sensor histidine kinase and response regulator